MKTFAEVFRFELAYRFRQWSTWLGFAAMGGLGWMLVNDTLIGEARGSGTIHANAPGLLALATVIMTMLMLAATANLFGDAAARDVESRMHPLMYTSPLSKSGYLAGRFLAAFAVSALLFALGAIVLSLIETQRAGQPELFGPMNVLTYIQPYFVISLPTVFATGAVMFAVSALSGRTIASYAAGAVLFFGAMLSEEIVSDQFGQSFIASLLDPFAFTALSEIAQYWTPFEKNTRVMPLQGVFLWNRVTWLAIAAGALSLTQWRFRFHSLQRRAQSGATGSQALEARSAGQTTPIVVPDAPQFFDLATRARQVLHVTARTLADVFATRTSLTAVAFIVIMTILSGWESSGLILETPTWPMTYLVAREVIGDVGVLIFLLTVLFTGELVWRERDAGASDIADALPVPSSVLLLGKFAAMVLALTALQALLMGAGLFLQWAQGYHAYELALYVKILFGFQLVQSVLWAALAMFVHVVVNQKYLAHFAIVLYWAFFSFGRGFVDATHNLLVYPADSGWSYSDISGFEPFLLPWLSFKAHWAAWAVLMLIVASLTWVRGRDARLLARVRALRAGVVPIAATIVFILITGGWIYRNTNVLNEYRSLDDRLDRRVEYERKYKRYEKLPQPLITRCSLNVDIDPQRRTADIHGTYVLANQTSSPIASVHVLLDEAMQQRALSFDRPSRRVSNDTRLRYQIYDLAEPLQPGQSMELRFHIAFARRGFANDGARSEVVENGTYFDRRVMPIIGYQPEFELHEDRPRKERGLAPNSGIAKMNDADALRIPSAIRDARWLDFEAVVSTSADQIAIAPGALRKTWTANGRRYFHYVTDAPIQNLYAIYSARYAVREDRWNGVALRVFHHPRHTYNLDRLVSAMKATLEYHSKHFGPYPHRELRIVEFPRHHGAYARAIPTSIAFSEGFGFMAKPEEGIDYPFLVAAHEVAHQWWGNQMRPARVEGGPVLNESLAHYGAMMAMEKVHGRAPVNRFRRQLMHKYLVGRQNRSTTEVPLMRSDDQKYLHYDKGALVMYSLREHIGEERVNAALRRMFERHRFGAPPYATTAELYAELKAVTPPSLQPLLEDLFAKIRLWKLRVRNPKVEQVANGHRVTFVVSAEKLEADAVGRDEAVPMNDLVEIGLFEGESINGDPGRPLYLQKHRIRSGEQTLSVIVPRKPARISVDPYRMLIERELTDRAMNVTEVE